MFIRGLDRYGEEFLELTKSLNISAAGALLASPRGLKLNEMVSLRIPAPSPSSTGLVPNGSSAIAGKVIRSQAAGDVHFVAVEFVKPLD
jgi:hypothetical protein